MMLADLALALLFVLIALAASKLRHRPTFDDLGRDRLGMR